MKEKEKFTLKLRTLVKSYSTGSQQVNAFLTACANVGTNPKTSGAVTWELAKLQVEVEGHLEAYDKAKKNTLEKFKRFEGSVPKENEIPRYDFMRLNEAEKESLQAEMDVLLETEIQLNLSVPLKIVLRKDEHDYDSTDLATLMPILDVEVK